MPTPANSRAKATLVLCLVIVAIGIGMWLRPQAPPPSSEAAASTPPGEPRTDTKTDTAAAPSATPIPPAPLPSMAAPLALIADGLKARSDAGDPAAACRLAAELAYCSGRSLQRADFDRWLVERQTALESITDPQIRRDAATHIEREMTRREGMLDQISRHCEGVATATPNDIAQQWRRAALLGSPAAMKQYASGNAFRWSSLMDSLPLLAIYRGEAEAMATRVARGGDAGMVLALAAGYDPSPLMNRSLLAQSLGDDGARALAMYQQLQAAWDGLPPEQMGSQRRILAARIAALESELSPAERARANRIREQELKAWAPLVTDDTRRLSANGGQGDVHRMECGAPPGETMRRREPITTG